MSMLPSELNSAPDLNQRPNQVTDGCFHCGQPIAQYIDLTVNIDKVSRAMCCNGCQAVAQSIIDNGLANYYNYRTEKGAQATELVPGQLNDLMSYDLEEIQDEFVELSGHHKEVILTVENVSCAACAWLIERQLIQLDGLTKCNVNTTTSRLNISWDGERLKLSTILLEIAKVGYKAYPFQPDLAERHEVATANAYLRKVVVAGLATMQVMMFAMAVYFDALNTLSDGLAQYFRWISLIIVSPVIIYCAQPFYSNAIKALIARRLNMDVPVSMAILLAFIASTHATYTNTGETYFESVAMFAFFLLLGRYIEQRAKKKAAQISSNLLKLIPATAQQLIDGVANTVPAKRLKPADIILVKPGQIIPADGVVVSGHSNANESILTGESLPVVKATGDSVYASSENIDSPLTIEVTCIGKERLISQIIRLQEQASQTKPRLASLADNLAQYVVFAILALASVSYIGWTLAGSEQAFWIALSVLVATCPCALSLATPSAYTCASAAISRQGLLLKSGDAFDTLANITHVCFDKTGTLTTGHFEISNVASSAPKDQVLAICAALESKSQHPLASAFTPFFDPSYRVNSCQATSGGGIEATINGRHYKLGSADYVGISSKQVTIAARVVIYLACQGDFVASIALVDQIRPQSKSLVQYLTANGISSTLLTGDDSDHANFVAAELGITHLMKGQTPQQKLHYLTCQQQQGDIVAMFGDGVNDAPVLAGAHISFAMGTGSDIAKSSADVVVLHDDFAKVANGIFLSHKVAKIIKQNFSWAIGYNLLAVPFALSGMLPPYLAALGMSLSSVIVVTNSLRLIKGIK